MTGAMASSFLDPRNTGVHVHAGGAQQQVWAEPRVCEQLCLETCDGVRRCQAQQSCEEHLRDLFVARGVCYTRSPGAQHPRG